MMIGEKTNGEFFSDLRETAKQKAPAGLDAIDAAITSRYNNNVNSALSSLYRLATGNAHQGSTPNTAEMLTEIGKKVPELATPLAAVIIKRKFDLKQNSPK